MIQLALDLNNKRDAFKIAKACSPYIDILEAGTPLIKAEGIGIVKELKRRYKLPVLADLKMFDAGYSEVELAGENGADYATVLAIANNVTIKDFIEACKKYGMKSVADLMGSPLKRALFLQDCEIDYICVHSGLDEQKEGKRPFRDLKNLKRIVDCPLMVAGGITQNDIPNAIKYADIVVIGSAITKAEDPRKVAKNIRNIYDKCKS
jgi:3-hexulose-6-phosphate synthase/6-phospho-3-hexuloisomerase